MARFRSSSIMAFSLASSRACVFIRQFIANIEQTPAMATIKLIDMNSLMLALNFALPCILVDSFMFESPFKCESFIWGVEASAFYKTFTGELLKTYLQPIYLNSYNPPSPLSSFRPSSFILRPSCIQHFSNGNQKIGHVQRLFNVFPDTHQLCSFRIYFVAETAAEDNRHVRTDA